MLKNLLKIPCYNYWQGYYTKKYYFNILSKLENNSTILDVGVGTGYNLIQNDSLIRNKNLNIHGIDIDKEYNKHCYTQIIKYGLNTNILIELKDLFDVKNKYDYIIFGQSFPVIERTLMTKMIQHAKTLLNTNGKIIFIHHLIDDGDTEHIFYKIKPYLKYIPFIWVDSGQPTTKQQFENWLYNNNLKYNYDIIHTDHILEKKLNIYTYFCSLK